MGIGKVVALAFLREGARVVAAARTASPLDETARGCPSELRQSLICVPTDVSREGDVRGLVEKTVSAFGGLDILVNAAGIQKPIGALCETSAEEWIRNIHVNLIGSMLCCKHAVPAMRTRGKGKIVLFAGGGATSPRPYFSAYACAKAAVVRLAETIAEEYRGDHIDINAIAPGAVNSRMLDEILEAGERAGSRELESAQGRKEQGGASPDRAAELAIFLSSDASDGITGKLISAVWDDQGTLEALRSRPSSLYTLRRIDGVHFAEVHR
jgi:3-oxoacyl-[acyl-carrier protein] reductase